MNKKSLEYDSSNKKTTQNWRSAAETRFEEILKVVKDAIYRLKDNKRKWDEECNELKEKITEIDLSVKAEISVREAIVDNIKMEMSKLRHDHVDDSERQTIKFNNKIKEFNTTFDKCTNSIKALEERIEKDRKKLDEKLHAEKMDRETSLGNHDEAFVEIKETLEAIQWILTETMRLTSDQQILQKRQQLRLGKVEKVQQSMSQPVTDAEDGAPPISTAVSEVSGKLSKDEKKQLRKRLKQESLFSFKRK